MSHVDVIVGAGSAGCALAARLTEDPDVRVTVLEAGGEDTLEAIPIPAAWPDAVGHRGGLGLRDDAAGRSSGQIHQWPRGRVIGGSSSLNGMVYIRGNPADFDAWAYQGCVGWSYGDLLPLFKRMENVPDGDTRFRGWAGRSSLARRTTRIRSRPRSSRPLASRAAPSPTTSTASSSRAPATTTC